MADRSVPLFLHEYKNPYLRLFTPFQKQFDRVIIISFVKHVSFYSQKYLRKYRNLCWKKKASKFSFPAFQIELHSFHGIEKQSRKSWLRVSYLSTQLTFSRSERAPTVDSSDRLEVRAGSEPEVALMPIWQWLPWRQKLAPSQLTRHSRQNWKTSKVSRRLLYDVLLWQSTQIFGVVWDSIVISLACQNVLMIALIVYSTTMATSFPSSSPLLLSSSFSKVYLQAEGVSGALGQSPLGRMELWRQTLGFRLLR